MSQTRKRKAKRPAAGQSATAAHLKAETDLRNALTSVIITVGTGLLDRWLSASSSPAPAPRVPGYFDGYQHCIDEARYVVRTECQSCTCALCRKVMSDDEPLDPRLGERPRPRSGS